MLELAEQVLFEDRFLLAGRAERLAAFRALGDAPKAEDLAQSDLGPLLALGEGHCLGDQVLGACSMWRLQEVRRGTGTLATLSRLVAAGAGLTLLPESAAMCERAASPDLSFLRLAPPEPSRQIGLAHRVASRDQPWVVSGGAKVDHGSGGTVPLRRSKTLPVCEPFPVTGRVGRFIPWSCIARSVWRAGTG